MNKYDEQISDINPLTHYYIFALATKIPLSSSSPVEIKQFIPTSEGPSPLGPGCGVWVRRVVTGWGSHQGLSPGSTPAGSRACHTPPTDCNPARPPGQTTGLPTAKVSGTRVPSSWPSAVPEKFTEICLGEIRRLFSLTSQFLYIPHFCVPQT